jgi:hypothetical protein
MGEEETARERKSGGRREGGSGREGGGGRSRRGSRPGAGGAVASSGHFTPDYTGGNRPLTSNSTGFYSNNLYMYLYCCRLTSRGLATPRRGGSWTGGCSLPP